MAVSPVPEGFTRVTPYLAIDGASDAIDFYKKVFGATERMRMPMPDGKIGHAEIAIGDAVIMLSDEAKEMDHLGPKTLGGSATSIMVYVDKVDDVYAKALKAGGKEIAPLEDKFYGDRSAMFEDPWGHKWSVATHIEDVSEEEMGKRAEAYMAAEASK